MASLKPGSQQPLTKPADIAEHEKCEEKMKASVEWLRRDCADASARAAGRVTPALLANVRVKEQKLEEVATVGVRDGSMLLVTVFDEEVRFTILLSLQEISLRRLVEPEPRRGCYIRREDTLCHTAQARYMNFENTRTEADTRFQIVCSYCGSEEGGGCSGAMPKVALG